MVSRTPYLIAAAFVTAGLLAVAVVRVLDKNPAAIDPEPAPTGTVETPADSPSQAATPQEVAAVNIKDLDEPSELDAFSGMSDAEQLEALQAVTAENNPHPATLAYLEKAVLDRTLDSTVRNEMANAMVFGRKPAPGVPQLFIDCYDNPDETHTFRDFSVQFMGRSYHLAPDKQALENKLVEIALEDPTRIAGTAVLQLLFLQDHGQIIISSEVETGLLARLRDPIAPVQLKMSVLHLLAARQELPGDSLDTVRSIAGSPVVPDSLRRVAVAVLGKHGGSDDVDLLYPLLEHPNRAVVLAAKGALKRLAGEDYEARLRQRTENAAAESPPAPPASIPLIRSRTAESNALKFTEPVKHLRLEKTGDTAVCKFEFVNASDKPVQIVSVREQRPDRKSVV